MNEEYNNRKAAGSPDKNEGEKIYLHAAEDMERLYEESLEGVKEGGIANGKVVRVDQGYVWVDIGFKSEGRIPLEEFIDQQGKPDVRVGDDVDVLIVRREDEEGRLVLSKRGAEKSKRWKEIEEIYKNNRTIRGKIISSKKGGFIVDIGPRAFLPGSQADVVAVRDMKGLVGSEHDFKIIQFDKEQGNVVVSRRAVLEERREKAMDRLEEGTVVEGMIKNITPYGLFVDLGDIDGLVHITNISWGRVRSPSDNYGVGDKVKVKILSIDRERERVSLGIKQLTPDPWEGAAERYPAGLQTTARVLELKKYGAFVELEEGLEGLVHVSEISWTKKIEHPSQVLKEGEQVEVKVLNVDTENREISLSIKQTEENPWDYIERNYPVGTVIQSKVKNITDFGIFISLDRGVNGLVHVSDISWTKPVKQPAELYEVGQEVKAVVLEIDRENEQVSLGIKQLSSNPWETIMERYTKGMTVDGIVSEVTNFGVFVELEEGVEGLIHVNEIPAETGKNPLSRFRPGDKVRAKIINLSPENEKIWLSLEKPGEGNKDKGKGISSLGEILKEKRAQS